MIIVIKIQDIWKRYDEETRALRNIGISIEDAVKLAYGFAVVSCHPCPVVPAQRSRADVFTAIRNLLVDRIDAIDRLPFSRQSGYGGNDRELFLAADIVGEISRMLADAVIQQLGSFPPKLRLTRFIGPDLVLTL
jgi:hypothetical protein